MFSEGSKVFLKEPSTGHTDAGLRRQPARRAVPARTATALHPLPQGWLAAVSPGGLPLQQKLISRFMLNNYFQRYFRKGSGSRLI